MATPPYVAALEFDTHLRTDAHDVMRRLVGHFQNRTTDQAPEQYVEPVANYRDSEIWQREISEIHRKIPLPVALSAELPEPGSHKAMDVVGTPVLITRDRS